MHIIMKHKVQKVAESLTFMKHKTQKRLKPKNVRTANYNCLYVMINGSSNNFLCYPPDSHKCHNAVY